MVMFNGFCRQGAGYPQRVGTIWCQTDAHGSSPGPTSTSTCKYPAWERFPWSRWTQPTFISKKIPRRTEGMDILWLWLWISVFHFLSHSWLWLHALRAHGNGCTATGALSQAKYCQVVFAHVPPTHTSALHVMHYLALFGPFCFCNAQCGRTG